MWAMRVQDELANTVSKVDRVKQLLHFPAVEGFRFRSGSGGVFLGSKDLFVSEFAAAFHLLCHRARGKEGRPKVTYPPPDFPPVSLPRIVLELCCCSITNVRVSGLVVDYNLRTSAP